MHTSPRYNSPTALAPEELEALLPQLTDHRTIEVAGGLVSSYIEVTDADRGDEPPVVVLGGLNSHTNWTSVAWEVAQTAQVNPDSRVVAIDLPGHGNSSRLTREQTRELSLDEGVSSLASQLIDATTALGIEQANFQTRSTSTPISLEMAAQAPGLIRRIYGIEPTGTEDRRSVGMWRDHMRKAPADLTHDVAMKQLGFSGDESPFTLFEQMYREYSGAEKPANFWSTHRRAALLSLVRSANASNILVPTSVLALKDQNLQIAFDLGSDSPISNLDALQEQVAELDEDLQNRITISQLLSEGHEASSARLARRTAVRAREGFAA